MMAKLNKNGVLWNQARIGNWQLANQVHMRIEAIGNGQWAIGNRKQAIGNNRQ